MPRDRDASFDPVTVRKGQRRLDGLTGNVISLYAKGMTTGDIQAHLAEIYDTDISRDTISRDHRRHRRGPHRLAEPAAGSGLSGDLDRRHRRQDPRRPGRQPADLRGDGRQHRRRTRRVGDVGRTHRRGGRQVLDDRAHRAAQPRHHRHVHRLLRRTRRDCPSRSGPPGRWPTCRLASCTWCARRSALHVEEALGAGVSGDARDLHRPHRRGRRSPLRRVRRAPGGSATRR